VSYTNENEFDNLFQETQPEPTMSEERVRAIARDQHFKDLAGLQQATFALDQRRQAALQRAEKQHPGFETLWRRASYQPFQEGKSRPFALDMGCRIGDGNRG